MANKFLTREKVKKYFYYDPLEGVFKRRIALGRHGCHKAGQVAGTVTNYGYVVLSIDKKRYVAHRVAWLYVYGVWPEGDLDHINQNKADNRIANLRLATRKQNMQNVTKHKHNTSGYKGVSWHEPRKKWRAYIFSDYKQIHLGLFDTAEKAHKARKQAEQIYHSHRVKA